MEKLTGLSAKSDQSLIQKKMDLIYRHHGLSRVMDFLFRWELKTGYISRKQYTGSERHGFRDGETGITFRLQVNFARSGYTPSPPVNQDLSPVHCAICRENVGRPGKEALRVFDFVLGNRAFFLQLTPFPLFERHFVLVLTEPEPQNMNEEALDQMFRFLELAPEYTVCSNSDVAWAGSSILEHQHFQVFRLLHLPVMEAYAAGGQSFRIDDCLLEVLNYPMAVVRVSGTSEEPVRRIGWRLIRNWKSRDPGRNAVNLVLLDEGNARRGNALYIFLRNPDYRTPPDLQSLKQEGVGVIEAAGEAILPVPEDPVLWKRIRKDGLSVIKGIIEGNSPVKPGERHRINDFID